jgi:hypothetical protein
MPDEYYKGMLIQSFFMGYPMAKEENVLFSL